MSPDSPGPDDAATAAVPLLAGRYQILDKLGEGGMGTVFRARDTKLERAVAVKMLPAGCAPDREAVARFQREARALARLAHPGIIQAHDSGEEAGRPFLVMELVEGRSLAAVLREQGRIAPARAADFAYQAALALHHAHQNGLVHRDVKPSNLLLSSDGRLRLLDLGLARFLQDQIGEAQLTRTGMGLGTPDYVAPEQLRDARHADARSDIYSLGCTLYHLIAGRVPFPGSSFSEKVEAHETREPTPLEELCPEVPAGLALTVRRMLAKRPADRFRTMAEVAEALMPHVAGSSASFPHIRNTTTWDGSRLATMPAMPRRRLVPWLIGGAAAALLLVAVGLTGLATGWFRSGPQHVADNREPEPADTGRTIPPGEPSNEEAARPADDPDVLTVAQKPRAAQYQTIGAALAAVKAGQTIRVLDEAVYREPLALRAQHTGVILEAVNRATLEGPASSSQVCSLDDVADVTVRGFRVRPGADNANVPLVVVNGHCPGVTLEELTFEGADGNTGILLDRVRSDAGERPVVIRRCALAGMAHGKGIAVRGPARSEGKTAAAGGLSVYANNVSGCATGIALSGRLSRVRLCANTVGNCLLNAVEFRNLASDAGAIVLANNSLSNAKFGLLIVDEAPYQPPASGQVELVNNLLFGCSGADIVYYQDPGDGTDKDFMKGGTIKAAWGFRNNAREQTGGLMALVSVPVANTDLKLDRVELLSRNPAEPDFLRPAKDSPLAARGAGQSDPRFPTYIGAVPPVGIEPWDWDRAWRMPKDAQLLTVSKDPRDKARYETIGAALKDVKPWTTIRVLDNAKYSESLLITDPDKAEGLTLEAVRAATIELPKGSRVALLIKDVPQVVVRGFRFRTEPQNVFLIGVLGRSPGVLLDHLDCRSSASLGPCGIDCEALAIAEGAAPVVVRHCTLTDLENGIRIAGLESGRPILCRGALVCQNDMSNCNVGVGVLGRIRDLHVVGNRVWNCGRSNVYLTNLKEGTGDLLVANNTLQNSRECLEIEDLDAGMRGIEVQNNLLLSQSGPDIVFSGKDRASLQGWRFAHNWRQVRADKLSGLDAERWVRNEGDTLANSIELLSLDAQHADFLRPSTSSPLASAGAGGSLPSYVGATPPLGVPAWHWDRTWRLRVKRTEDKK
jgi:serine/threonine protein kinase